MNVKPTFPLIYVLIGLSVQVGLTYLLLGDLKAVVLSFFFSITVIVVAFLAAGKKDREYTIKNKGYRKEIKLLQNEVRRLQRFNKVNLTTIKKLKSYSISSMEQLKTRNIDFLNTAENMDTPVVLIDEWGVVNWLNIAAEKLYGFSRESLKNESITDFFILPGDITFRKIIENLSLGEQELEFQIKRSSGSFVWTHSHFSYQRNAKQEIRGIVIVQMDISTVRSNEEQLRESLERARFAEKELKQIIDKQLETNEQLMMTENTLRTVLEKEQESKEVLNQTIKALKDTQGQLVHSEKMASLGQLTAGIAHELNNPINFIYNGIDSLKRSLQEIELIIDKYVELETDFTKEKLRQILDLKKQLDYKFIRQDLDDMLQDIKEGAIRTIEIVKGLRVFSRLDEEDQKEADINECLDATITLLHNKLKSKITLNKKYDDTLDELVCYPGQLNQVFMNMINNAIQAFRDDHKDPVIQVSTQQDKDHVIIGIKDNGIGMSEDTRNRIFEPFFTTKPVGVGTGLGMSISYGIIEKHKGRIELDTTEGKGTEFKIILPKNIVLQNERSDGRIKVQA